MNGKLTFKKNIAAIRIRNPELASHITDCERNSSVEIEDARDGGLTLRVDGRYVHSRYDPEEEAKSWAGPNIYKIKKADCVYVLGFGLGYHVEALWNLLRCSIVVVEPRLDILAAALEARDLSRMLSRISVISDLNERPEGRRLQILEHEPSVNLDPVFYKRVKAKLTASSRINSGLKILVVSPIYGGSLPIAGHCSSALRKLGHDAELLDFGRFSDILFFAREISGNGGRYSSMTDRLSDFFSESVLAKCEIFRPDLVLALAQAPIAGWALQELKEAGIGTAYWFVEDFRVMEYWKNIAPVYDHFFAIQRGEFFKQLKGAGIKNYAYLPLAANPDVHRPMKLGLDERNYFGSEVSFAGAGYYNRRHFLKGLLDRNLKIWGSDWENEPALAGVLQRNGSRISTEETALIYNASDININLHSSTYHKGVNPFGDFVNPRSFEIASCGAFQLVDKRAELDGLFREGEEIVCFEGIEDLRAKIDYYLNHPDERIKIAAQGRLRVLRDHTYESRMGQMLDLMIGQGFVPSARVIEGRSADELIERAGPETELGKYLSRFAGEEDLSFDDIAGSIQEGEGALSETERIIMMMREAVRK